IPTADPDETHRSLAREVSGRGLTVLDAAPAQDANTFVVARAMAERYGLRKLSDLARYAPRFVIGGPPECPSRPFCLPGLEKRYGLYFKDFILLDAGGSPTRQALDGRGVDV